jgi:hypothetical protein
VIHVRVGLVLLALRRRVLPTGSFPLFSVKLSSALAFGAYKNEENRYASTGAW